MAIEKTGDGRVVMDKADAERLAAAAKPKADAPKAYWSDEDIPTPEQLSKMNDHDMNMWAKKMDSKRVSND